MRFLGPALLFLLIVVGSVPAAAQSTGSTGPPLISQVTFEGSPFFPVEQLRLRVRTRANRGLLGIRPITWWLWLYRFGNRIGGSVGRGIRSTGEPPALLDSTIVNADVERLRLFYAQEGFRSAMVRSEVATTSRDDRVQVRFIIEPGPPTFLREVRYEGLDHLPAARRNALAAAAMLRPPRASADPLRFRVQDVRFSEPVLLEEGRRLLSWLRNEGYAAVTRDSVHAVVVPSRPDSFDVIFDVRTGPRFRFGDLAFVVQGPDARARSIRDTLALAATDPERPGGRAVLAIDGEPKANRDVLLRTLQFRPGDWYNQDRLFTTKRRLDATGIFAFTEIVPLVDDTLRLRPGAAPRLPHRLELQTRPRHQIRMETFMLQRSGALADSDNELGTGIGLTYNNLNLFGEGESFQLRSTGSISADLGGRGGFTSAQWEVAGTVTYPYLIFPFGGLENRLGLFEARTRLSISLLAARRDALRLVLRGRGSARYRLEMRHTPTLTSLVDLLDVSVSNPDTLAGFSDIFLLDVLNSIDDPVQRGQVIEDYTRPQINNALRYTFRSTRVDPFRRDDGYSYETSFEVGGNLPYLLDRYVYEPDSVNGSIPGLPIFKGSQRDNRLIYRQYVRFVADLRRYVLVEPGAVLAYKLIVGVAQPTGSADVVPFDRRFYSGGAGSVRAWRLRQLGPGAASFASEADSLGTQSNNILGGEIKLEASVEVRRTLFRSLFAAEWMVALFADAGNVWSGPRNPGVPAGRFRFNSFYREIGVGAGWGVRIAWDYLIVRLDFAYKVHDPLRRGVIMPDGYSKPVIQFGIGHTF